jgi:hypothetical protein
MRTAARLIGFVAVLAVIFAGAYAVGGVSGAGPGQGTAVEQPPDGERHQPGHNGSQQKDHQ